MTESTNRADGSTLTRVLCVDDNRDITDVMRIVIDTDPTLRCVGSLASAECLIDELRRMSAAPDVVLLDATMPGKCPFSVMREMSEAMPAIRTIVYSGHGDPAFIERARNAGAWGFVCKADEPETILLAVRAVAMGQAWWPRPSRPR